MDLRCWVRCVLGKYDGDLLFVVRNEARQFGLMCVGFGSCSGCDLLQAVLDDEPGESRISALGELRDQLCDRVVFYAPGDFLDYLNNKDYSLEYWGREDPEQLGAFIADMKNTVMLYALSGL
jgi:hypothetical protein